MSCRRQQSKWLQTQDLWCRAEELGRRIVGNIPAGTINGIAGRTSGWRWISGVRHRFQSSCMCSLIASCWEDCPPMTHCRPAFFKEFEQAGCWVNHNRCIVRACVRACLGVTHHLRFWFLKCRIVNLLFIEADIQRLAGLSFVLLADKYFH